MDGDNSWHEIVLFPSFHTEETIRQLRLDVYEEAHFDIDWIRICPWATEASPTDVCNWSFGGDTREWLVYPGASELFAPPVRINANGKPWITVQLASYQEDVAGILWACKHTVGLQTEDFSLEDDASGALTCYPLVDTGWDSRPWHGNRAMIIEGRTAEGFEQLLHAVNGFCREQSKPMLILGPINEWGEGSYIEPCTEVGFDMLEAIRRVFAKGDPEDWPMNTAPSDVALGPYDFPPH